MITDSDIQKIKQYRQEKKSGKEISKLIHKRYKDTLKIIRKIENRPEPTKRKKLISTSIKYLKPKKAIKKEKILAKKKQQKKIKKITKTKQKRKQRKTKQRKQKQYQEEIREKQEEIREIQEPNGKHGYYTVNFECTCIVSDRKIVHDFAVREEVKDMIESLHYDNYPEHNLQSIKEGNTLFHEYSNKPSNPNVSPTQKQKTFLKHLGYSKDEISTVKTKEEASNLIRKR